MMLGDNLYSKMIFLDVNIGICTNSSHQCTLNLSTSVIGMVKNSKFRVSAFAMKIKATILHLVEISSPVHKFFDLFGGFFNNLLYGFVIADVVTSDHGVLNVFVEIVNLKICY